MYQTKREGLRNELPGFRVYAEFASRPVRYRDHEHYVNLARYLQSSKTFGLYPRKGSIVTGADADLVVFDPTVESTISAASHHHNCDRNIFEGYKLKGAASHVIVNGKVQFKDGKLDVERGAGRYLPRSRNVHY